MKQRVFYFLMVLLGVCFSAFSGYGQTPAPSEPDELVLAVHPYRPIVELHKRFTPLVHYLEKKTGKKIRIEVSDNFADHAEKVGNDRVDFSFLEAPHYVVLTGRYGGKNILAGMEVNGSSFRQVMFVVRKDSSITSLSELAGKKVAFHGHGPDTGHLLIPKNMLKEAGVALDQLASFSFIGSHSNVAMAVLCRNFDAGLVMEDVYTKLQDRGLRMLVKSGPIPEPLFVASPTLSPRLAEILRESLLGLKDAPEGKEILESIKEFTTAFVPLGESDFEQMRNLLASPAAEGDNR